MNTIRQAILFAVVMLALGPIAARIASGMRLPDGGPGGLILAGPHPLTDLLRAILIIALAALASAMGAILRGPRHALVAAGLTIAWAAWATPGLDELLRRTRDPSLLIGLALDAALLSILTLLAVLTTLRLSRSVPNKDHDLGPSLRASLIDAIRPAALPALALTAAVGALAAFIVARSPLEGQTFAAAAAAGLAGAAIARIVVFPATLTPILIGAMLIVIAAPTTAIIAGGSGDTPIRLALAGSLPGLAWITPWAAIAGLLVGVPLGATWAEEVAAKQHRRDPAATPPTPPGVRVKRAANSTNASAEPG